MFVLKNPSGAPLRGVLTCASLNTKFYFSEPTETLEISDISQFFGNSSTSSGSKNFSMGDMMVSKVFKRLPQIRALQRTSNHSHTISIREDIQKNSFPPPNSQLGGGERHVPARFAPPRKCKKICSKHFFVRVLAQNFFNYHETHILSQISFCKNSYKNECSSESETKILFGCTK